MTRDLTRLLRPESVAVVGGGAWCLSVFEQLEKAGFAGPVWPVHPTKGAVAGLQAYPTVADLPAPPDASFVGVNRDATIDVVAALSDVGAGGAVCFASGFAEVETGAELNANLLGAAGEMPFLGPNCYGFINALDGAMLWPDQHGLAPVDRGVAILMQSSNIAINLTMQRRGLPIAYMITCGNQAQTTQADIARALLDDPRVTAIGLHVEGFGDLVAWQALARDAAAKDIPLIALKVGASAEAQAATISHTASLAGSDAGARAFLDRLGISRAETLDSFLEALKLLHLTGPLGSNRIATISCSGGEASLSADTGQRHGLRFPPLTATQTKRLAAALGPKVALANPLDYHTYIWRDAAAMTEAFVAMDTPGLALIGLIVDFPRADRCDPSDWDCVIEAATNMRARIDSPVAMIATLPELMPEVVSEALALAGVIPMAGLDAALAAIHMAVRRDAPGRGIDLVPPGSDRLSVVLDEATSKEHLSGFGLEVPKRSIAQTPDEAGRAVTKIGGPVVIKGQGLAHKTEAGAVRLGIVGPSAAQESARDIGGPVLIEEQITGTIVELLIGVVRDPAHGFVLTIGAGGTWAELLADTASLLLPASDAELDGALGRLRIAPVIDGYRGQPAANRPAIFAAIRAVEAYVLAHADRLDEVEINPLICTPDRAVAVDALIRIAP